LRTGEPIREILRQTTSTQYDLTIIGAERKGSTGLYWRAEKSYEVIKAIPSPVLLATGACETLKSFVVCTGGKDYIDAAVELTGRVAAAVGASVTLLHVMAEPPAIYADLVRLGFDVENSCAPARAWSQLARAKKSLERLGWRRKCACAMACPQSGFRGSRRRKARLIVTGSSQTRGPLGALHHGRSDAEHRQSRECPGARGEGREIE
jgi:nucleotide-binding universal stress UspA family protein